jgi:hypothetical protein
MAVGIIVGIINGRLEEVTQVAMDSLVYENNG